MTNTNRARRRQEDEDRLTLGADYFESVPEKLRGHAATLEHMAGHDAHYCSPSLRSAATLIEHQGREIERYREGLTKAGQKLSWNNVSGAQEDIRRALESPTQAPPQGGER